MRKTVIIIASMLLWGSVSFAQSQNDTLQQLQKHIENLEKLNARLSAQVNNANSNIKILERKLSQAADSLGEMRKELSQTNKNIQELANTLGMQIQQLSNNTDTGLSTLNKGVNTTRLYLLLAFLGLALLITILFWFLKTRLTRGNAELSEKINSTSEVLREDMKKLDNQLFWSLDTHLKISKTDQQKAEEADHTLALKVADEIIRIQKILNNMAPESNELKQIAFALDRIQDDFKEDGYEMAELLNKPYDQGMKVSAKFKPDDTLKHGEQIITRIIKPQINYKGNMIQAAQVEVSVGK